MTCSCKCAHLFECTVNSKFNFTLHKWLVKANVHLFELPNNSKFNFILQKWHAQANVPTCLTECVMSQRAPSKWLNTWIPIQSTLSRSKVTVAMGRGFCQGRSKFVPWKQVSLFCFVLSYLNPSRKHAYIILTPLNPILYSKTGVYRGIHYFSYFRSKT